MENSQINQTSPSLSPPQLSKTQMHFKLKIIILKNMYFLNKKVSEKQVSQLPHPMLQYSFSLEDQVSTRTNQKASQDVSWVTTEGHCLHRNIRRGAASLGLGVLFCFVFQLTNLQGLGGNDGQHNKKCICYCECVPASLVITNGLLYNHITRQGKERGCYKFSGSAPDLLNQKLLRVQGP